VPLRPLRLPRDGRQLAGPPPGRESFLGQRLEAAGEIRLSDLAAGLLDRDEPTRRIVAAAGRHLGAVIATIIGLLDVERIVLHGSVASLGEAWAAAVRDEASRRSLGLLSKDVSIELAAPIGDPVVMGASALLLTAELGLAVGRRTPLAGFAT
jgi:predicted NBD/HSP70 family sugar kinase